MTSETELPIIEYVKFDYTFIVIKLHIFVK
uniref:Uncharacterized protein n=1 Tax=Siphoviridae sp. ctVJE9 TaxID=2825530 RepID=A0A8S5TUM4_9CAUD|nr:MAG TPA: hypothetical protein [Siphoviridae sp. ctVJE9]